MVFDLRRALLKKGEVETARLEDFEFRLRVRTWRALAAALDMDDNVAARVALAPDDILLAQLAEETGRTLEALRGDYERLRGTVYAALVAERGDPSPVPWA